MKNKFDGKGLCIKGMIHLSPQEAYQEAQAGALLLDIREEYDTDYKKFDVPEVFYCPYRHFEEFAERIPKDRALIVAASTGLRSKEIVEKLSGLGFYDIANLNGGMVDWERDGLPMNVDKNAELHGQCVCRLRRK
jgi:rhodanese-related sulfurtransferase